MAKADLHVHSTASDGWLSPAEVARKAKEAGLQACALTDHDTLSGWEEFRDSAESCGILPIKGIEVSSAQGHIVGLYIEDEVPKGKDWAWTVSAIRDQGGLAMAVHPFSWRPKGVARWTTGKLGAFDIVEVINGPYNPLLVAANVRAVRYLLTNPGTFAWAANTDQHEGATFGSCYTAYDGDLFDALTSKTTRIGVR